MSDSVPPPPAERRKFPRVPGNGLMANANGKLIEVIDISFGGMKLGTPLEVTERVQSFTLIPRDGDKLALNESVRVSGTVIRSDDQYAVVKFSTVTMALSKLIVRRTSEKLGVAPYYVK